MSELDKLRELLNEAGVSYLNHRTDVTIGYYSDDPHSVIEAMDHSLQVTGLTAEQVIRALGPGTCNMEPVKDYRVSKCATSWGCVCSSCGGFNEFTHGKGWRFCPSCGKRIVWEVDE